MTVKLAYKNSYENRQGTGVGANSLELTDTCFVTKAGNVVDKAAATELIVGVNDTIATYASDNESADAKTVNFTPVESNRLYEVTITGGTITAADEGKYYDLSDEVTVDGATESTTTGQVELVTFKTATNSIFKIVNL